MARLIVSEMVTLDGVMQAPGGEPTHPHTGWTEGFFDDAVLESKMEEVMQARRRLRPSPHQLTLGAIARSPAPPAGTTAG